ncbi:hypothetical protein ARMGADRAFT_927261, partial [Armillaria gallica]
PFESCHDFELVEFILDAALTKKQMKNLFGLLKPEAASNQDSTEFNIRSPKEFKEHWDHAANLITPFEKSMVTVSLQGEDYTYNVYWWNLWTCALDLIQDPTLELYFVWDAVQLSKWNGEAFERFIDEPWTAQAFWDLQMKLPKGAKVLYYIIYADKTCLSSFETAQGYPVIAHLGNLKIGIRNSNGVGGGCIIGWLPVEKGSLLPIESCDYKEASVIGLVLLLYELTKYHDNRNFVVLTPGSNGKKPCVICLVPKSEQNCLHIVYELQTKQQTQEILTDATAIPRKDRRNTFLSGFGLRNISENTFWNIKDCDSFWALSFVPLHAHDNGLFGDHLRDVVVS